MNEVSTAIDSYRPIADHGLIGNLHTAAVVALDGAISWFCPKAFDRPSMFASILDNRNGGHWALMPSGGGWIHSQLYMPDTAILVTRFQGQDAAIEIADFMPIPDLTGRHPLIRRVTCTRGSATIHSALEPRFGYGETPHVLHPQGNQRACFATDGLCMTVESTQDLTPTETGGLVSLFPLAHGESATFVLFLGACTEAEPRVFDDDTIDRAMAETRTYWRTWCSTLDLGTRWREQISRSAITLKLLTYAPTGAIVAAPTTSLPENIRGERNWDYRYTWIRDGSFTVQALIEVGSLGEAGALFEWVRERFDARPDNLVQDHGPLQIMYLIDGGAVPSERALDFEGYRGSRPVRIGNNAAAQLQLDIYGELLDAVLAFEQAGGSISAALWEHLTKATDWLAANWDRTDAGIWEIRGGPWHFTYARLMCWVAIDRALHIARTHSFRVDVPQWEKAQAAIRDSIYKECWDDTRQTFVQHTKTTAVDAALLMMPLVGFMKATAPEWLSTLAAIEKELVVDGAVDRYNAEVSPDGLAGGEGAFTICSFWYVRALIGVRRLADAQWVFAKLLDAANHVGLYAEELGPRGEALGNFPQAFSHLAFIQTARALDVALESVDVAC